MISARQLVPVSEPAVPTAAAVAKRFRTPDQMLVFDSGRLEVLTVGGEVVAKGTYVPGWRWSSCTTPSLRMARVAASHVGLVLSGRARLRTGEGTWVELTDGDLFQASFGPTYDLWVIGSRPCEVLYVKGVESLIQLLRGRD